MTDGDEHNTRTAGDSVDRITYTMTTEGMDPGVRGSVHKSA